MSWPADGKPRFVVATTQGMRNIGTSGSGRPMGTSWLVLDRANLHALVAEYRSEDGTPTYGTGTREQRHKHWELTARRHAERLNAEHEVAGGEPDHTIHVTVNENASRFGNWATSWSGDLSVLPTDHATPSEDTTAR